MQINLQKLKEKTLIAARMQQNVNKIDFFA